MQNYYEINVSYHGVHLFATHPRSLTHGEEHAKGLARQMMEKFPKDEGYSVTLTYWQGSGFRLSL